MLIGAELGSRLARNIIDQAGMASPLQKRDGVSQTLSNSQPQEGIKVSLSINSQRLNSLLEGHKATGVWTNTIGEQGVIGRVLDDVLAFGSKAKILEVMPDSNDPYRIDLAKQAVDFAVDGVDNPFSGLPRETLSNIGFDESGAFTPAERYAAMAEISVRDGEFRTRVAEQVKAAQANGADETIKYIVDHAEKEILLGMSDVEKQRAAFYGMSLSVEAEKLPEGLTLSKMERYSNVVETANSMLSAISGPDGKAVWKNLPIDMFIADIESINSLTTKTPPNGNRIDTTSARWTTLYLQVANYGV